MFKSESLADIAENNIDEPLQHLRTRKYTTVGLEKATSDGSAVRLSFKTQGIFIRDRKQQGVKFYTARAWPSGLAVRCRQRSFALKITGN